jgi:hypothetical protein
MTSLFGAGLTIDTFEVQEEEEEEETEEEEEEECEEEGRVSPSLTE